MTGEVWSRRRTSFGSRAQAYAAGRPTYPAEALDWILPRDAGVVLDLGAGTGRLTERLLERGLDVVAVEPLEEMRAFVPAAAQALAGTAEDIPLADASVDAVVAGQAFHWFDVPHATREIARVLRPGGTVGVLWNVLDESDEWTAAFADLIDADERSSLIADDQPPPYPADDSLTEPQRRFFRHAVDYDADRLVAFVESRSQTILLPADDRASLLHRVRAAAPEGPFGLPFVCEAWRGERRP